MNFNLKESQEELGQIHEAAMKLVTDSEARNEKTMPSEINAQFDDLMAKHTELEKDIKRKLDIQSQASDTVTRVEEKAEKLVKSVDEFNEDVAMKRSLLNSYIKGTPLTEAQLRAQKKYKTKLLT